VRVGGRGGGRLGAATFHTFAGLVTGLAAQTSRRTVCGMLVGAGPSRVWPHDRVHYFFAKAAWSPDRRVLAGLVTALLVPADQPVQLIVDDTLFKRRGRKV
jgi:SRSO17 transposase